MRPDRRQALLGAVGLALGAGAAGASVAPGRPKLSLFLTRPEGLSRQAFVADWLHAQAPMVAKTPGLASLVFNEVDATRTPRSPYDAVAELEFASFAALDRARASARLAAPFQLVTSTVAIRPLDVAHAAGAKRIGLVSRPPGRDRAAFYRAWRDEHGVNVGQQVGLAGYALNFADAKRSGDAKWDGYAELWWPDWPTYDASMRQREATREPSAAEFFHDHLLLLVTERLRTGLPV